MTTTIERTSEIENGFIVTLKTETSMKNAFGTSTPVTEYYSVLSDEELTDDMVKGFKLKDWDIEVTVKQVKEDGIVKSYTNKWLKPK